MAMDTATGGMMKVAVRGVSKPALKTRTTGWPRYDEPVMGASGSHCTAAGLKSWRE